MPTDYDSIYELRKNKFGDNHQARVKGHREKEFEDYLAKTPYKITFLEGNASYTAALVPFKQDITQTLFRLLTRNTDAFYGGYTFSASDGNWMILYREQDTTKGYTAYVTIKFNITVTWTDRLGEQHESLAYLFGPMRAAIADTIRSGSIGSSNPVWREAFKVNHLIMPTNHKFNKDDYIVLNTKAYLVTGFDWDSAPGVMFVTLDETLVRDTTDKPTVPVGEETKPENFWISKV